jgi:protein-S-isoprenylcysteine O-methyltransferase Ste14
VGDGGRVSRWRQLRAELSIIWPEEKGDEIPAGVRAVIQSPKEGLPSWDSVLEAELLLIQSLAPAGLRVKHGSLNDDFAALAGGGSYATTYLARLATSDSCDDVVLRAEAIDLAVQTHRLIRIRHGFGLIRSAVGLLGTWLVALFCVFVAFYFFSENRSVQQSTFATGMLILAGMLGGCVSALARLNSVSWTADLATGAENLSQLFWSLVINFLLAVLEGGIFAILLYLAFMGNLVSGILFPSFRMPTPAMAEFQTFMEAGLASHGDFAKAIVWCFVAGFSERLVPEFINTLGGKLKVSDKA